MLERDGEKVFTIGEVEAADEADAPVEFVGQVSLMNVGVLVSGSGTNLQALHRPRPARRRSARPSSSSSASNVPDCAALARARAAGIPTFVVDHRDYSARARGFDRALVAELRGRGVELVVLAGFMRVLGDEIARRLPRPRHQHPPRPAARVPRRARAEARPSTTGVKLTGCTVHFVDAGTDTGPIIAQAAVLVHEDDDEESLRARILAEEHRLLPAVVRAIAERRVVIEDRRVRILGGGPSGENLRSL